MVRSRVPVINVCFLKKSVIEAPKRGIIIVYFMDREIFASGLNTAFGGYDSQIKTDQAKERTWEKSYLQQTVVPIYQKRY